MREASLEEIQQYLPDGHPDKIPNKVEMKSNENPEFKIGDWVTVVDSDNSYSNYRKAIGYTFQIRGDLDEFYFNEFINGKESAIDPINKYGVNYRLKDIRKATQEEIDSVTKPKEITESIKTTSEQYDLSTITRAVKNNDPSIIARETGKSIDELCELVDKRNGNCLCPLTKCEGLSCIKNNCPFIRRKGKTKESSKAWLRGKSKQSLSDYEAVHVNSQEKWDCVS